MPGSQELYEKIGPIVGCAEQREAHQSRTMQFTFAPHILRSLFKDFRGSRF